MRDYFIRRFLLIIPTLIGVTLIVFVITRFMPGGPLEQAMAQARAVGMDGGGGVGDTMALSEDQLDDLKELYGFDKPVFVAYLHWLGDLVKGDLGKSFLYFEPVSELIARRLPVSIYFGLVTLIITYATCIPLGIVKAVRHLSPMDSLTSVLVFVGYAIPGYALGVILLWLFAFRWNVFPDSGFTSYDFDTLSPGGKVMDVFSHTALPLVAYLVSSFAFVTFLMKNHLLENLAADYVRTAIAKGVTFKDAVRKHALRNSLIPIATNLGQQVSVILTGSVIIETIFDIDGIGLLFFKSAIDRDYPVVLGLVLISAFLMMVGNILSDIFVAIVDPRVRFK